MTVKHLISEVAQLLKVRLSYAEPLVKEWLGFHDMDEDEQDDVDMHSGEYRDYILGKAELYDEKVEAKDRITEEELSLELKPQVTLEENTEDSEEDEIEETKIEAKKEKREEVKANITKKPSTKLSTTDIIVELLKKTKEKEGLTIIELLALFTQTTQKDLSGTRIRFIMNGLVEQNIILVTNPDSAKNKKFVYNR